MTKHNSQPAMNRKVELADGFVVRESPIAIMKM